MNNNFSFKYYKNTNNSYYSCIGTPFRRYSSYTEPQDMEQDIKYLLGEEEMPSMEGNAREYYEKRMPRHY